MTRPPPGPARVGFARRSVLLVAGAAVGVALGRRLARAEDDGTLSPAAAAALARDPGPGVAGNPDGGLDVIEFFDYRCTYCRQMEPRLATVAAHNASMRVIYKEWPVFGGISVDAARLALAAGWQGGYAAAHAALWTVPPPMTPEGLRATL
ncbi:DsbA family protein, partial [Acidisphaera rubrifaciens]|uniref:DsbA family protein n=1 Tax=Acidisphaera rubrifaciens TaxID=50715 RepID=UPI00130EE124